MPDDFDGESTNVSRSDLYELPPGTTAAGTLNQPGRHLGYFELLPDGILSFPTVSAVVPVPQITGIQRDGAVMTLSFPSVTGATYRLRATDSAGLWAPASTWSVGASITAMAPFKPCRIPARMPFVSLWWKYCVKPIRLTKYQV